MTVLSRAFWAATAERAIKTFAQSLLAVLAVSSVPLDVLHVNWFGALSVSLGATLLSLLTSLSGLGVNTPAHEAPQIPLVPAPAVDRSPSMGPDLP